MTEPPEPTCSRCGEYVHEEDQHYCPECGADIQNNWIRDDTGGLFFCVKCDTARTFRPEDLGWKCSKCGYDGKEITCIVCDTPIHPRKREQMCDKCKLAEDEAQWVDEQEYLDYLTGEEQEHRFCKTCKITVCYLTVYPKCYVLEQVKEQERKERGKRGLE